MAEKIVMPQLGESIAEGTIVKWLKKPGDSVKKDEDLLVISTDKVEAEIPAPSTGTLLSIDVPEGETVNVGTVLGYVGEAGEKSPGGGGGGGGDAAPKKEEPAPAKKEEPQAAPAQKSAPAQSTPAPSAPSSTSAGRFVSPLVRRIAADNGIGDDELNSISGTGNNGRVTKKDLQNYIKNRGSAPAAAAPQPSASSSSSSFTQSAPTRPSAPTVQIPAGQRELVQPASSMRKVIMKNMVASKATSAHVHTFFDVDYTNIDRIRAKHKKAFKDQEGVGLTYTTFLAAATAQVLKRHPYINAEIRGTDLVFKKDVHLGMAVAIDSPEPGLMVPVVRAADQMNLRGLAHAIHDLATRVRSRRIKPDELSGGTFTITNPGNYGAIIGTPVINQPQVAILGVGRIQKEPVVKQVDGTDVIAIRNMGVLSLGFDHRLIDGATADLFMADLKTTLENWTTEP